MGVFAGCLLNQRERLLQRRIGEFGELLGSESIGFDANTNHDLRETCR